MTFGEKIRALRKQRKLTQTALAEAIGVSMRTIQSYESGLSYPKNKGLWQALADTLSCTTDYLRTEEESALMQTEGSSAFLSQAEFVYGSRGARQARELVAEVSGLFAGGELDEEDMDEMMKAIQDAYWVSKKMNRKYIAKKYRPEDTDGPEGGIVKG